MANHLKLALKEIDAKLADLKHTRDLLAKAGSTLAGGVKRTRTISAKARKAISKAQKARWAAVKKEATATAKKLKALV